MQKPSQPRQSHDHHEHHEHISLHYVPPDIASTKLIMATLVMRWYTSYLTVSQFRSSPRADLLREMMPYAAGIMLDLP